MADLPLTGVRIVDLSRVLAGPMSTMVLADLGADVIKVEHPSRGDDTRDWGVEIAPGDTSYYYAFNRNKRSISVDLETTAGQTFIRDMIVESGVVVENFRAGGMEKFGLGYEALKALRPDLIYCSISGYDRAGTEAARPGYDLIIQGETGLMSINGEADCPPVKFGVAAVDMFTGMSAAQAVLAALFQRERDGRGRKIDIALYDCGLMLGSYFGLQALVTGRNPPRFGNSHPAIVPYGVFDTADGPVVVAVGTNEQFFRFCNLAIARPDLADHPDFQTNLLRAKHRDVLIGEITMELLKFTQYALLKKLKDVGIPCGEVAGLHDALTSERAAATGMILKVDHPSGVKAPLMAPPWRLDGERLPARRPPTRGEHDADIDMPATDREGGT